MLAPTKITFAKHWIHYFFGFRKNNSRFCFKIGIFLFCVTPRASLFEFTLLSLYSGESIWNSQRVFSGLKIEL